MRQDRVEVQAIEHGGSEQQPGDDRDTETRLPGAVQVDAGRCDRADEPVGHGRQKVARMQAVMGDIEEDPLAHQPSSEGERERQEDDHKYPASRESHGGKGGGERHRSDRGDRDERREHRVAQVSQQLNRSLGHIRDNKDEPHRRGKNKKRIRQRGRHPEDWPGGSPRLGQTSESEGNAEQIGSDLRPSTPLASAATGPPNTDTPEPPRPRADQT